MDDSKVSRILFVGDMHLGRRPGHLVPALTEHGLSPRQLGPAAAWRNVVEYARAEAVDCVVFAGDLVEADNARFEAFGHLQRGVLELVAADIEVCAVSGNHDVEVLPRLAKVIPDFHLIGAQGRWERHVVGGENGPAVAILGWSYPQQRITTSPLSLSPLPIVDEGVSLGVLHCDLDATSSRYAPVRKTELRTAGPQAWFLGHIHKPSLDPANDEPGYLGSLVGLDPSETGRHGPWLVTVDGAGRIAKSQLPLAPLRWEELSIVLDDPALPAGDLEVLVIEALRRHHAELAAELGATRAVGCRIRVGGSHDDLGVLERAARKIVDGGLASTHDGVLYFIDRIAVEVVPTLALAELARGDDPCALLARKLLALQEGRTEGDALIDRARSAVLSAAGGGNFVDLEPVPTDAEHLRRALLREGYRALDALLAQRRVGHATS